MMAPRSVSLARSTFSSARRFMSRRPIVGGNWKCNPASASKLPELIGNINACDTSKCDVYVCPSPLHVALCSGKFTNDAKLAPQNCNFTGCGAYTGEMAVDQMADMGIEWVLLGHSERRGEFGLPTPKESNALLATKLAHVLEKGLNCVFCIGELPIPHIPYPIPYPDPDPDLDLNPSHHPSPLHPLTGEPLPIREKGIGAVTAECIKQLTDVKGE